MAADDKTQGRLLPDGFEDLERFKDWCLPTAEATWRKKVQAPFSELQELYEALLPRMEAIVETLRKYRLDNMPPDVERLLYLGCALKEIATSVEYWGASDFPDLYPFERWKIVMERPRVPRKVTDRS